jgi:LPXTG-motif cell wall-anchored protein
MSDPREFERDPNLSGNRYVGRQTGGSESSAWIIAGVIVVILLGLAAYSYNGASQVSSSGTPEQTSGQSTRAPVPNTPPAAPVAPRQ